MADVARTARGLVSMLLNYPWTKDIPRIILFILVCSSLTGVSDCKHQAPISYNKYSHEPSSYKDAEDAASGIIFPRLQSIWSGVTGNPYYVTYTANYTGYVISGIYVRLTSKPKGDTGVCSNYDQLDQGNNESYLGIFVCPLPFEPEHHTYCCGEAFSEYCCEPNENRLSERVGLALAAFLLVAVITLAILSRMCKKKDPKEDEQLKEARVKGQSPEEVKVVSRPPSKARSEGTDARRSGTPGGSVGKSTSCTSVPNSVSDGDNGYGSGALADTRALNPAYPPTMRPESQTSYKNSQPHGDVPMDTNQKEKNASTDDYKFSNASLLDDEELGIARKQR